MTDASPLGVVDRRPRVASAGAERCSAFGLTSAVLHLVAVALLIVLTGRVPMPERLEEPSVEMVFEAGGDAVSAAEPVAETLAEAAPPEPVLPEPVLPEPAPPEPVPPEPVLPKPAPIPINAPPPRPQPPPKPPKPVQTAAPPRAGAQSVAATPVAPVNASPPRAEVPAVDPAWQSQVASWLVSHKTYPEAARRRGEEGRVAIRFTVDRSGQVLETEVAESSGSERLDAATVALLRGASLPAFPASMARDRVTIVTSLRYTLR